jgi:hypothetical protein
MEMTDISDITKAYFIGDRTMEKVFEPFGLTDASDLQAVFDAVEEALGPDQKIRSLPEMDEVYIIPRNLTDAEWDEVKYTVDRKGDLDIPLRRIKEAIKSASLVAGQRGLQLIREASEILSDQIRSVEEDMASDAEGEKALDLAHYDVVLPYGVAKSIFARLLANDACPDYSSPFPG